MRVQSSLPMASEEDNQKSKSEQVGQMAGEQAGKRAGRAAGSRVAGSGASSAASSGGSAAGGSAAAGTAAGAGGTAAGAGAAGGATAGSVVPGAGTAAGAAAGAAAGSVVGKNFKNILFAIPAIIVGVVVTVIFFIILPVIIIVAVVMIIIMGGGGSNTALAGGSGLNANYCKQVSNADTCSEELRKIIIAAGNAFRTPPAVIAAIMNIEDPAVLGYDDATVLKNSAPGAKDTEGIPRSDSRVPVAIATQIGCAVSVSAAAGPMQFTFGEAAQLMGFDPAVYNTWGAHADDAEKAINDGRTVHPCNIKDAIFAGSHKLKEDSDTSEFDQSWVKEDVYKAAAAYVGATVEEDRDGCFPDYAPTVNYCLQVWNYYVSYSDNPVDDGSNTIPNGWPTTGYLRSTYGNYGYGPDNPQFHPGLDLPPNSSNFGNQKIYSPISGNLTYALYNRRCGGQINIESNGTPKYRAVLLHLDQATVSVWNAAGLGTFVEAGQLVGVSGDLADIDWGNCWQGSHLHYEVYQDGVQQDPLPYTPNPGLARCDWAAQPGCENFDAGGGNWLPHE